MVPARYSSFQLVPCFSMYVDYAHGINQKAELKKKKRTRKDTQNVEALGMSMEMTLLITDKLVGSLFHENKCVYHTFSCV